MATTLADFARKMRAEYPNDPERVREEVAFARSSMREARREQAAAITEHARKHPEHPFKESALVGFCATCFNLDGDA